MRLFAAFKGFAVHWFHVLLLADSAAKNSPHAVMQKEALLSAPTLPLCIRRKSGRFSLYTKASPTQSSLTKNLKNDLEIRNLTKLI